MTLLSVLFLSLSSGVKPVSLSKGAKVSLLTSTPVTVAVYTLYGHTAIRIKDDSTRLDVVFNYGVFDFTKCGFIYRFAKGGTDYILSADNFNREFSDYLRQGSGVCEQVIDLLPDEKERLWQSLQLNAMPENRVYRYNFFFDNCATRPYAMIEKSIDGRIDYWGDERHETFRHAVNVLTRKHEWLTLGCDLVLGLPADRVMTQKERLFLPENLKYYLANSVTARGEVSYPTVLETNILSVKVAEREDEMPVLLSPMACFSVLFVVCIIVTLLERKSKRYFLAADCILFFVAGIAGSILFFLSFLSIHPCMFPNMNLLWLHPFHLVLAMLICVKKLKRPAFWYHFVNFAVILAMCVAWLFIPQHFNIAFIPLIAVMLLRSGEALLRKKLLRE
jgi:hypothetical protein